jgi:hypothetical protein
VGNINLPIILSNPHFLFADASNLNNYEGITPPTLDDHNTVVLLEPVTGIEFKANKRLQFNINLVNDSKIRYTLLIILIIHYLIYLLLFSIAKNITPLFFPLFWIDENFEADKSTADTFYKQLKLPVLIINIVKYTIVAIAGILLFAGFIVTIIHIRKKNIDRKNARENEDTTTNWISSETTPLIGNH